MTKTVNNATFAAEETMVDIALSSKKEKEYVLIYPEERPGDNTEFNNLLRLFASFGIPRMAEYDVRQMVRERGGDEQAALAHVWRNLRAFWFGTFASWPKLFIFSVPFASLNTAYDPVREARGRGHAFPPEQIWGPDVRSVLFVSHAPKQGKKLAEGAVMHRDSTQCFIVFGGEPTPNLCDRFASFMQKIPLPAIQPAQPVLPTPPLNPVAGAMPDAKRATTKPAVPHLVRATRPPTSPQPGEGQEVRASVGRYSFTKDPRPAEPADQTAVATPSVPPAGSSHPPPRQSGEIPSSPIGSVVPQPGDLREVVNADGHPGRELDGSAPKKR